MPPKKRQETPFVRDSKSLAENLLTREMHPTDGNMMGFEEKYGTARPTPEQIQQMQALPIDATVRKFRDMYGDEQAIMVLDELVRIQEDAGAGLDQRAPSTLSEMESYGLARRHPTDSNLMGHEGRHGYAPSVAPNPPIGQSPFRSLPAPGGTPVPPMPGKRLRPPEEFRKKK